MSAAPATRLLLIDNYDSFTYNLVQAFMVLGAEVLVHRNDQISVDEARALQPTHLCISPGPGTPYDAGVSMQMIDAFAGHVPVLGVCLGHQSLVEVFGGKVVRAARLMHGKTSYVHHDGRGILAGLPEPFEAGRYHSLIAQPQSLPAREDQKDGAIGTAGRCSGRLQCENSTGTGGFARMSLVAPPRMNSRKRECP